jgi:methylisocitrate lyase
VRAFERAGVAGLFIEDQVAPKRCGHMEGKRVVPVEEMVAKIKAALDARSDTDLVIMARTDARAVEGLEAAVGRAQIYREAGADLLFVEAPLTVEEMTFICADVPGPCMANNVEGGMTPILPAAALEEIGYAMVAYPVAASYAIAYAVAGLYEALARDGSSDAWRQNMVDFASFNELVGLSRLRAEEAAYEEQAREIVETFEADRE